MANTTRTIEPWRAAQDVLDAEESLAALRERVAVDVAGASTDKMRAYYEREGALDISKAERSLAALRAGLVQVVGGEAEADAEIAARRAYLAEQRRERQALAGTSVISRMRAARAGQ